VKQPGHEVDHSPPPSANVRNGVMPPLPILLHDMMSSCCDTRLSTEQLLPFTFYI